MAEDRVDRRLAAIFAGDIAGYSRLMASDEEGTLRQLKAHRKELIDPKIIEHRGRIIHVVLEHARIGRAEHGQRHFVGDAKKRVLEQFEFDRVADHRCAPVALAGLKSWQISVIDLQSRDRK